MTATDNGAVGTQAMKDSSALAEKWKELRAEFAPGQIGKLPKRTCKKCSDAPGRVCSEHEKRKCQHCQNYMTTAHIDLDYVGHAQVTARLLDVDPTWTWEPVAFDVNGLPAIIEEQGGRRVMWIKMTVLGVTRFGVGIVDKAKGEVEKELISDALRNAAMRFGVALDLWAKGDLNVDDHEPPTPSAPVPPPLPDDRAAVVARAEALDDEKREKLKAWITHKVFSDAEGWEWGDIAQDGWWEQIEGLVDKAEADRPTVDTPDPTMMDDPGRPFEDPSGTSPQTSPLDR
jgi:hypothetical protein